MAQRGIILRALIASPGDLLEERVAIPEVIAAWNATHSWPRAAIIEPVKWESHSVPLQEGRPQALINQQLGDFCDFLIGLFWTRLGTNTGVAASGTVEEIQEFIAADKPVLLYYSKKALPHDLDIEQFEKLKAFKKEMRPKGIQHDYDNLVDLRGNLDRHLNKVVDKILEKLKWNGEVLSTTVLEQDSFKTNFKILVRSVSVEWEAERDSNPRNLDEGKRILRFLVGELIAFSSLPENEVDAKTRERLLGYAKIIKHLDRQRVFLDGGKSFRQFWDDGDQVMADLTKLEASM